VNCNRCGSLVGASDGFCGECGAPIESALPGTGKVGTRPETATSDLVDVEVPAPRQASSVLAAGPAGAADAPAGVLPGSPIRLGDGEVVWRQYRAIRLRNRRRGQGTLYVTDARIVFFAWAKGRGAQRISSLVQQVKLEDVSGLAVYVSRRLSTFLLLLGTFFALATIGALVSRELPLTLLFAFFTVICVAALFSEWAEKGQAGVTIHSREADNSPVQFGGAGPRHPVLDKVLSVIFLPLQLILRSWTIRDVLGGRPGDDSDLMIAEMGALVMDLQTRGTFAAGHYGVEHEGEQAASARRTVSPAAG